MLSSGTWEGIICTGMYVCALQVGSPSDSRHSLSPHSTGGHEGKILRDSIRNRHDTKNTRSAHDASVVGRAGATHGIGSNRCFSDHAESEGR